MTIPERAKRTWQGDWEARILGRIRKLGFENISDFLKANKGKTYYELAESLGDDVAPIQIVRLQMQLAKEKGELREAAMDCLPRCLRKNLPKGWTLKPGNPVDIQTASVYVDLDAYLVIHGEAGHLETTLSNVWDELKRSCPPAGWLPADEQDPYLKKAFDTAWPCARTPSSGDGKSREKGPTPPARP